MNGAVFILKLSANLNLCSYEKDSKVLFLSSNELNSRQSQHSSCSNCLEKFQRDINITITKHLITLHLIITLVYETLTT